jgi:hypothetical protein
VGFGVFGEGAGEGEFVYGLVLCGAEFFFGEVLSGEVSEGTVRIFGGVLIFPWFIGLIVLLLEYGFELVLAWIVGGVHCMLEAGLSRRRELAT